MIRLKAAQINPGSREIPRRLRFSKMHKMHNFITEQKGMQKKNRAYDFTAKGAEIENMCWPHSVKTSLYARCPRS